MLWCWLRVLIEEDPTGNVDDTEEEIVPEEEAGFNEGAEDNEETGFKEGANDDMEEAGFKEGTENDEEEVGFNEGTEDDAAIEFGAGVPIGRNDW